jgi:hypothetical protein
MFNIRTCTIKTFAPQPSYGVSQSLLIVSINQSMSNAELVWCGWYLYFKPAGIFYCGILRVLHTTSSSYCYTQEREEAFVVIFLTMGDETTPNHNAAEMQIYLVILPTETTTGCFASCCVSPAVFVFLSCSCWRALRDGFSFCTFGIRCCLFRYSYARIIPMSEKHTDKSSRYE